MFISTIIIKLIINLISW